MKQLLLRSMFMLTLVFSYTFSNAQTDVIYSKTSEADCQKKCQNKNVKKNNSAVAFTSQSANNSKADCPLKGTPDCPLVKDCPLKGTPDCPWIKKENASSYAAKKTSSKKKATNDDLPACCRKNF